MSPVCLPLGSLSFRLGLTRLYFAAIATQEAASRFHLHLPLIPVFRHNGVGFGDNVLGILNRLAPTRHHRGSVRGLAGGGKSVAVSILHPVDGATLMRLRRIAHHLLPAFRGHAAFGVYLPGFEIPRLVVAGC